MSHFLTLKHHLTMVPSVMVGDSEGILTSVPAVEPPVGAAASDSPAEHTHMSHDVSLG